MMRLAVALTLVLSLGAAHAANGELEVHFLDVGQGDCTFVSCPDGETVLIDCGSTHGGDAQAVRRYLLNELGTTEVDLDTLVITHPDIDHYNMLPDVVGDGSIGQIFRIGRKSEYADDAAADWIFSRNATAVTHGKKFHNKPGFANNDIDCGEAEVYVLAWNVKSTNNASNFKVNTRSIVLLFLIDNFDVILTGDATRNTEKVIIERYGTWLDSEVLKVGHHGSEATSTGQKWVDKALPEFAVVSAHHDSQHHHPRVEVIERLEGTTETVSSHDMRWFKKGGSPVNKTSYTFGIYSTAKNGNIVMQSDGSATPDVAIDVPFPN